MKMIFLPFRTVLMIASLTLFVMSCKDDDDDNTSDGQTVLQIAVANNDFDVLEAAALKAGSSITNVLSSSSKITVFAPTDAAFISYLGATNEADAITRVNALTSAQAADLLSYHVLNSEIKAAAVPAGPNAEVTTLRSGANNKAYVTKSGSTVSINGATVTTADVQATNGVIHIINQVLYPPAGNLVETASANTNFELLVAAVTKADLAADLSGSNPLTVFAPTDSALLATLRAVLGNPNLTEADAKAAIPTLTDTSEPLNVPTLKNILLYHVVSGRNYSAQLTAGAVPTLLTNNSVTVALPSGGVTVTGSGNGGSAAKVVMANITTTNGVIHVIDRVLLPAQ
ncbi:fasciclin domain-containing protein [Cytophagaceae bacterium YF14B1]|uniref:Fasciclin domain-containing protein n=1 Tax=Xanthocytophaga flava TaxID=3048013 RepID=A0AAE3UBX0_9BACT|nr:fasciclin domain-containing protein [Xanthocytophaga flavus]MDJ1484863.1 fasciclin domain-containing protein [Xanthocytophaga flavus]